MIIPFFVGSIALGATAGVSALTAVVIARRGQKEYEELRRGYPLLNSVRELEFQIEQCKADLDQLQQQRVNLTAAVQRYEELEKRLPALERTISDLEVKKAQMAPMEEEHRLLGIKLSQRKLDMEQQEHAKQALEASVVALKTEAEKERRNAAEQRTAASIAKAETDLTLRQRDALIAELTGLQATIAGALSRLGELQTDIVRLSVQETGLRTTLEQHQEQLGVIKESILQARIDLAATEGRIVALKQEEDALRKAIADLAAQKSSIGGEIVVLLAQHASAEREVKRLRSEIEELVKLKAALEVELSKTSAAIRGMHAASAGGSFTLMDAAQDLFDPFLEQKSNTAKFDSEEAAVKAVQSHASGLGFQYPDRVIRAFHTSLKLGRQAPLLVLAGISGTGKSQLPRLYCDALGINFLPMAVQPGWDSPADLMGFFSHIEHRFKPTTLARAMAQMDPFLPEYMGKLNKEQFKRFEDTYKPCHKQVTLVLLDEMNLARVEYYFSDFLSRLELRNAAGFDAGSAENRKRVQLVLEAPGATDDIKQVPLFPGDNVIFVGTMNEDESTMSLSDKVIDRANVLRFGKPEVLKASTGGNRPPHVGFLSIDDWRKWAPPTSLSGAQEADVKTIFAWTNKLNNALDCIQRPFAHRTAAAIQAYCLAYPGGTAKREAALKLAFADQIEQRVMPKLRGIDPTSAEGEPAITQIIELIQELGDSELQTAVTRGKGANDGQSFVWYGARRKVNA